MPKDTIRAAGADEPFEVKVGWERDRGVQVGVEVTHGRSLFWQLLESYATVAGAEVRRIVAEANEPGTTPLSDQQIGVNVMNMLDVTAPVYRGLWADLDRAGCNDLIRVLRRGRDQAFGRDE